MSDLFKFNGTSLIAAAPNGIFQTGGNNVPNYTPTMSLKLLISNDNPLIKNTNVYYQSAGTDLAQLYLPYFVEYFYSGSSQSVSFPTWCTKIQFILIGGGGFSSTTFDNGANGGGGGAVIVKTVDNVGNKSISCLVGDKGANTTLTYNSITYTANTGQSGNYASVGIGGEAGDGDINFNGQNGFFGTGNDGYGVNGLIINNGKNDNIDSAIYGRGASRNLENLSGYIRIYFRVN
jgi:hypothetical protein